MSSRLLGIDLGTTGIKATVFDEHGSMIVSAYREYGISSPRPGMAEQDPSDWWKGLVQCTHELEERQPGVLGSVAGIGLCGQMHTHVYLDAHDEVLGPAITWMDQRSAGIVSGLAGDEGTASLIFDHTANSVAATYTAPNCLWVQRNQPDRWKSTSSILLAKDYLKWKLTGVKVTDYSDASGTMLFDVPGRRWSDQMFGLFGVPRQFMPESMPSDAIIGSIHASAARETGLRQGTPIINGASDNSAAALGAGMRDSGQATLIIGTAGVVSVCSDAPRPDPRHRVVCWNYCLPDRWINLGVTQTAGESLNWFRQAFDGGEETGRATGDIFETYNRQIANVPDGSGGLVFLPYLNGERTPYWDSDARGVFFGASLSTAKGHFIKSVMEGVSFALRNNVETVESLGVAVNEFRAVGGGLKSRIWLSSLARILGRPITTVPIPDAGNWGNALLCGMALGVFSSLDAAPKPSGGHRIHESPTDVYEHTYTIFLKLYEDLKDTFRVMQGGTR